MAAVIPSTQPPGPPGHFLLGHLPEFGRDVLGFLLGSARDYGPVVRFSLAGKPAYLLTEPEHIAVPLLANYRNFIKNRFFWRQVEPVVGKGLLTSEGDFWRRQRRLASPAFHQGRIAEYGRIMVDFTREETAGWRDGESRDLHHDMMRLTSRIVAKTLFDEDVSGDVETVGAAMDVISTEVSHRIRRPVKLPDWVPLHGNWRFLRAVRQIDRVVERFIADHRRSGAEGRNTLLAMLMQAVDEDGSRMSDRQLRDESITLFLAGHETTAIALSWTVYLLTRNPGAEAALAQELASLGGRAPQVTDLPALPYTEAVVKEAMRVYPPAYLIGREAIEACEIGGYAIPAGATVYISPWVQHRDARFFPEPEEFRPERWLDGLEKRLPRFAYMPFGGGPRTCIGDRFALMEAALLLAAMLQHWHFEYRGAQAPTPFPSVTLRPAGGVPVRISARA